MSAAEGLRPRSLSTAGRPLPLIAFAMLCGPLQMQPAEANDRRVVFPHGASAVTLKGRVAGRGDSSYLVKTVSGQVLQVLFSPSNRSCAMNVFQPGQTSAAHIGTVSGNEFGSSPTRAGDYRIQVYLARSAARRGETCRYALSVELTGTPTAAASPVTDDQMARRCRAEAARMYGVGLSRIRTMGVVAAAGAFHIDAIANKGKEGRKKLRCHFKPDRTFSHIMALTSDGE